MKKIIGFSEFANTEGKLMLSIFYSDDDNFEDFVGLSSGSIVIPRDFVDIMTFDSCIHLDDTLEIVPKISRKGKLYKTVSIGD